MKAAVLGILLGLAMAVLAGEALAFAEYAPSTLFPRLARFPAARAASADACYLAYCFVDERHRGRSMGVRARA